ncbi:Cytidyltransferase-like domain [Trypanosoma melophagium]|uniref:Cytidyltransferase-like domain n=1 Tax=Trypanosoma melophagium TaxID=715481 RepID=UPI00351A588F|nr:Cytidyltransferase-like domain [Trypanosoma melophagium]
MNPLRLRTLAGLESNRNTLLTHLNRLCGSGPVGKPSDPLYIHLQIDDGRRDTLLQHVKLLYDAALQHHPETFVSVIPLTPPCEKATEKQNDTSNYSTTPLPLFTSAVMTANSGFEPVYAHVALGGTFDRLHAGHKLLLTTALFYTTKTLRVGVTLEAMLTKKAHAAYIQPFEARSAAVSHFLRNLRRDIELDVIGITEASGGTDRDPAVEALVVSAETAGAIVPINTARASNGLAPLKCIEIPYVAVGGDDNRISSTALRKRIDERERDGR